MTRSIQVEIFSILIITTVLMSLFFLLGRLVKKADVAQKPGKMLTIILMYYQFITNLIKDNMGSRAVSIYGPYIGVLTLFLVFSNLSGLTGIAVPTANYSVTLTLALITFTMLQYTKIKINGLGGFLKGFLEPFPPFIIPNLFGFIAPLISMSLRLFGNLTAGSVIMALIYIFTGFLSSFIPWIGQFNFVGVIVAPALHAYFDVFSGLIQTYIFISLTTIFIGNELPQD